MELIDRNKLMQDINDVYETEFPTADGAFDLFATRILPNVIKNEPTIDAVPITHARWICDGVLQTCSNCGYNVRRIDLPMPKYCEDCGAKIDEETEEE